MTNKFWSRWRKQACQGAEIFKREIFTFGKFVKVPLTMIGRLRKHFSSKYGSLQENAGDLTGLRKEFQVTLQFRANGKVYSQMFELGMLFC